MTTRLPLALCFLSIFLARGASAQVAPVPGTHPKQLVIIDSDIGDDIDDAFAIGLALQTPEFKLLGITTAFGDTKLRAQLAVRLLAATGHQDIPVVAGIETAPRAKFSQAPVRGRWRPEADSSGYGSRFYSQRNPQAPGPNHPHRDWTADQPGRSHRQGPGNVSQAEAHCHDGGLNISRIQKRLARRRSGTSSATFRRHRRFSLPAFRFT